MCLLSQVQSGNFRETISWLSNSNGEHNTWLHLSFAVKPVRSRACPPCLDFLSNEKDCTPCLPPFALQIPKARSCVSSSLGAVSLQESLCSAWQGKDSYPLKITNFSSYCLFVSLPASSVLPCLCHFNVSPSCSKVTLIWFCVQAEIYYKAIKIIQSFSIHFLELLRFTQILKLLLLPLVLRAGLMLLAGMETRQSFHSAFA